VARKKKRSSSTSIFKIFIWLCVILIGIYYAVNLFVIQPRVFYPGFQIEIPRGYDMNGIDVSRYQQVINWKEVKNMEVKGIKIGFAFMKATEGISNVDPQFRRNWLNAEDQNIPKGAYHFFIPGKDAKRQANNFMEIVSLKKGDLPPVLDIEIGRRFSVTAMQKEVRIWLDAVEKNYGVKPIIYTNIDFYQKYFQIGFEDYPLWIAHYLEPNKPRIENKWVFWQHSESGRVNGIKAPVDFNVFYGDSTDFNNLLIQ
jgi:lysozyme